MFGVCISIADGICRRKQLYGTGGNESNERILRREYITNKSYEFYQQWKCCRWGSKGTLSYFLLFLFSFLLLKMPCKLAKNECFILIVDYSFLLIIDHQLHRNTIHFAMVERLPYTSINFLVSFFHFHSSYSTFCIGRHFYKTKTQKKKKNEFNRFKFKRVPRYKTEKPVHCIRSLKSENVELL